MTGRDLGGPARLGAERVHRQLRLGGRGATYNPNTGVAARGGAATVGNAYTGTQNTAKWGQVSGPRTGSRPASPAHDGNHYADHDGNVYRNTGSSWQTYNNGSWNNTTDENKMQSLNAEQNGRWAGDQRSAGSSWGSSSWGGGFNKSGNSWGGSSSGLGRWQRRLGPRRGRR